MRLRIRAFTLLETMVALAIFSISIIGCVAAIESIGKTIAALQMEGEARRALESHASELRGTPNLAARVASGNPAVNGIEVQDEIEPLTEAALGVAADAGLFKVRSIATWTSGGVAQTLTQTLYVREVE